jgi:hypothetical protein
MSVTKHPDENSGITRLGRENAKWDQSIAKGAKTMLTQVGLSAIAAPSA